ncbi:unnamed protein product [Leuciscus chuanchicus]
MSSGRWSEETPGLDFSRNTVTPAHLDAFESSVTHSQNTHVTVQHVKLAALRLLTENEGYPVPHRFLTLMKYAITFTLKVP